MISAFFKMCESAVKEYLRLFSILYLSQKIKIINNFFRITDLLTHWFIFLACDLKYINQQH